MYENSFSPQGDFLNPHCLIPVLVTGIKKYDLIESVAYCF